MWLSSSLTLKICAKCPAYIFKDFLQSSPDHWFNPSSSQFAVVEQELAMITADRLLESLKVTECPVHAGSSLVDYRLPSMWWFPGLEWGQLDRFCPPPQSIIRPVLGRPGSRWLSDFLFYKQAGKQPLNFAIRIGVCVCGGGGGNLHDVQQQHLF